MKTAKKPRTAGYRRQDRNGLDHPAVPAGRPAPPARPPSSESATGSPSPAASGPRKSTPSAAIHHYDAATAAATNATPHEEGGK